MAGPRTCLRLALPIIAIAVGLADTPAAETAGEPAPPAPAAETARPVRPSEPMDFVVMEGDGPLGHRIWIQASGRIMPDTALKFVAVSRTQRHRVSMIAFDSTGGDIEAAIALGRQLRATRFDTVIGHSRLAAAGAVNAATFMAYHAGCYAACVYAFAGGINRTLPNAADLGLHSVGLPRWAGGTPPPSVLPEQDFVRAQKLAVELILWLEEAGVDPTILLMTSLADNVPDSLDAETAHKYRIARFDSEDENRRRATTWMRSSRDDEPLLSRRVLLDAPGGRRLDADVTLSCDADNVLKIQLRLILMGAAPDETLRLRSAAITFNGAPLPPLAAGEGEMLAVPRAGLVLTGQPLATSVSDMPSAPAVALALTPEEGPVLAQDLTPGLAEALPDFLDKCRVEAAWRP